MNEIEKRLSNLEIRLSRIEKGLEKMGISICKCCGEILEMDTEKHIKSTGSSEIELNGWYCSDDCYNIFIENFGADKSGILPF